MKGFNMTQNRRSRAALVIILSSILLLCTSSGCSHWLDRTLPVRDRTVTLDGLARPAQVIFDRLGVPHIRAGSLEDALFIQGYVTAQDRLFFMDFHRRLARGELAEILGKTLLPIDRFLRTIGMSRMARQEARLLDPETRGRLEAYAAGVNAYIDSLEGARHFGFSLLCYDPRPWTVEDSLALCKGMSWILDRKWLADIMRARLRQELGPERAADLLLEAGPKNRPIVGVQESAVACLSAPPFSIPLSSRPFRISLFLISPRAKPRDRSGIRSGDCPSSGPAATTGWSPVPGPTQDLPCWRTTHTYSTS